MKEDGKELLKRLDRPLSFLGSRGSDHILIGGRKVRPEDIIDGIREDPSDADGIGRSLKERLEYLREKIDQGGLPDEELLGLFGEAIAIKRVLHILKRVPEGDEGGEDHKDIRRWLDYSRRIR